MPMPARKGAIPPDWSPEVKKAAKSSKTIRANKRKAKLRAKHRRQRAWAGA
jgi:hypothetical protein